MTTNAEVIDGLINNVEALKEAKHILEVGLDKYGPHFLDNRAYQDLIKHIEMKLSLAIQERDLWESGGMSV